MVVVLLLLDGGWMDGAGRAGRRAGWQGRHQRTGRGCQNSPPGVWTRTGNQGRPDMQVEEGEMDGKTGLTTSATDGRTGATPLAPVVLQHQIQVGSHPSFNWEAWRAARRPGLWAPHPLCALVTSGASTASTTATLALAEKATQARVRPVRAKPGTSHGQGLRPMQAGRLCASAAPQANHANGDAPVLQVRGAQPESGRGWMAGWIEVGFCSEGRTHGYGVRVARYRVFQ